MYFLLKLHVNTFFSSVRFWKFAASKKWNLISGVFIALINAMQCGNVKINGSPVRIKHNNNTRHKNSPPNRFRACVLVCCFYFSGMYEELIHVSVCGCVCVRLGSATEPSLSNDCQLTVLRGSVWRALCCLVLRSEAWHTCCLSWHSLTHSGAWKQFRGHTHTQKYNEMRINFETGQKTYQGNKA